MKKVLITGARGQDGSYLSELLLNKGYDVHGLVRRTATPEPKSKVGHLASQLVYHYGDLLDYNSVLKIVAAVQPDEIYNLGAISNVPDSFHSPQLAIDTNGHGFVNILEAVRQENPEIKVYQASTTELFGKNNEWQSETTPLNPQSPYAIGKYVAHTMGELYRSAYGLYVVCGILGNHESPRRGYEFLTKKVTSSVAKIYHGQQDFLYLGNLETKRDWGYAKEYMEWAHIMLQQPNPDTYVLGTGESHSIQAFVEKAFSYVGLDWNKYVRIDEKFLRPKDEHDLKVDYKTTTEKIGFEPKVKFEKLIEIMMDYDLEKEDVSWKASVA